MAAPAAMAMFHTVIVSDWARSVVRPATRAAAAGNRVGAPPKARPHRAVAAHSSTGLPPASAISVPARAKPAVQPSTSGRNRVSITAPTSQMPSTEVTPNTSSAVPSRPSRPCAASTGPR